MAIIVSKKGSKSSEVVDKSDFVLERNLQEYICDHPEAIPVEDKRLLVVARELQTESGPIDAFAVDVDGDLYVVETKLYRNPDKRTVVAQAWTTVPRYGGTPISLNCCRCLMKENRVLFLGLLQHARIPFTVESTREAVGLLDWQRPLYYSGYIS